MEKHSQYILRQFVFLHVQPALEYFFFFEVEYVYRWDYSSMRSPKESYSQMASFCYNCFSKHESDRVEEKDKFLLVSIRSRVLLMLDKEGISRMMVLF